MGSLKVTLCAGAALAAICVPATAARAADGGGFSVTPAAPAPGSDVTLRVPDCTEKTAVAVSAAFVSDVRLSLTASDGALTGTSRVRTSMAAGVYAVRVTCGRSARKGTVTIGERRREGVGEGVGEADRPSGHASPVAPVDAGGGGAARLAAGDPGTAHTVTGLVLAGIAAVAVALRGVRSRSRGKD
ncbi:hypothetical protein ACGFZL_20310 [Streptomyces sp. NPDC048182]|uniref:hypothetical protein n=1 Tax=Streptomyces sp. NPDC048182 TaxID=3365507 RepID=UPI00370F8C6D